MSPEAAVLEFGAKGYGCAQILLACALRLMGRENPDLVRAMSGLTQGGGGELCGALSGGFCLLGLYCGRGKDAEQADADQALLLESLSAWFRDQPFARDGLSCEAILGKTSSGMDPALCAEIVSGVWRTALALLTEHGLNLEQGREAE
ncbi:MAG: C-GCAxxG-C-C family protein [Deltaproteobacteria bacterium]|jgi:hypothetical protein|nr:C-GCAxxG-C-C family protein [Deltaproteobacteria bacterium]